jgi:hypothetical protein
MGNEMIERELIEDIESRLGMAAHNLGAMEERLQIIGWSTKEVTRSRIDLEAAFKSWLTLRTKLQAAGVVSNVGGGT